MKPINSTEIARLAGVSRSTVSRVINGYANVPEKTREHVMKVIEEYHYTPLLSGQLLTGKKTHTIGLFWIGRIKIAEDPQTSSFFMHVVDAAAERGYLVLSCILDDLVSKENIDYTRKIFNEGRIDAGLFIGVDNDNAFIPELIKDGKIVGMFDYFHENWSSPNLVSVNFERESGEKVIDYLYALGHRTIGIVDGDLNRISSLHRHEGFMRGMEKHHLSLDPRWMTIGGITQSMSYPAVKQMLMDCGRDLPTAICANNDSAAFGVYTACHELGLRVPEDVSITGFDGHMFGEQQTPPLTTYGFNFKEMFSSLVYRMIDTIEEKEDVKANEFIRGKMIERSSCRCLFDTDAFDAI